MNKTTIKTITLFFIFAFFTFSFNSRAEKLIISESSQTFRDTSFIYQGVQDEQYLNNWLILGPIPVSSPTASTPDEEVQKKSFEEEPVGANEICASVHPGKILYNNNEFTWQSTKAINNIMDIRQAYKETDFMISYAFAEINMPETKKILLGVGSDDAIKIWINNKLVHENWTARGVQIDNDLIPVELKKGHNEVLIKVQNLQLGWGFTFHIISKESYTEKLIYYSSMGNVDAIKILLASGVNVNATVAPGLTALHAAKLAGKKDVIDLLIDKGADENIPMPPKEKIIDAYFNKFIKEGYPGASVLVARDGNILFEKSYGLADIENKIPINNETKFRIGSVTKQFTASAILKLQEQGLLNVTDPLSKFIPDYPRGNEVTIHHLLTHTSGIYNFTNKPVFFFRVGSPIKEEDLINEFKKDPFDFNPGDKYSYSNSGFFILGYIVEKVSGLSYSEFLKKNFFEPLGMKNTGVYDNKNVPDNEAKGYGYGNSKISKALYWDMSWTGGAGSIYSSVEDLYKWNEALFGGKILNEASMKAAFTPAKTKENANTENENGYGYGWGIFRKQGLKEIGHAGGLHGFNSDLIRYTDQNLTVVVLLNCAPIIPGLDAETAAENIAQYYLWEKMEPQE